MLETIQGYFFLAGDIVLIAGSNMNIGKHLPPLSDL